MEILSSFIQFIKEKKLFQPDDKILVAVSGGVDSMVLCDLLLKADYSFSIAHCNFQLRGNESDEDEKFIQEFASKNEIEVFTKKFETEIFAKQQQVSIQMAARQLRYEWFEELKSQNTFSFLATAHHINDSLETVIFNLTKGTGISGLRGILPKQNNIVRPLLFATKTQIEEYAYKQQIQWREDASNASEKYSRNLIRHQVIPILQKLNPALEARFSQTQEKIAAVEKIFLNKVDDFKNKACNTKGKEIHIEIEALLQEPESVLILHGVIENFGFNYDQSKQITNSLNGQAGKAFYASNYAITKDRTHLIVSPRALSENIVLTINEETRKIQDENFSFQLSHFKKEKSFEILKNATIAQLDFNKLQFPLTLRSWDNGDFFYPLGMKGKKKISDFLTDLKIPLHEKESVKVLTQEGQIIWVVGLRIDNRFKITGKTNQVYQIELQRI